MKAYRVEYKLYAADETHSIKTFGNNKEEAYTRAEDFVLKRERVLPYSMWVESVTYANGRTHRFNTFEGKRF